MKPSKIRVYKCEKNVAYENHVSAQGFGYSAPLETPRTDRVYVWEGKLYHPQGDVRCSNSRPDLAELAQNLASQLKTHPSPRHNQAGVSGYEISFEEGEFSFNSKPTHLELAEQAEFFEVFNKSLSQKA